MKNFIMATLARDKFAHRALDNAILLGAKQYVEFTTPFSPPAPEAAEKLLKTNIIFSEENRISKLELPRFAKVNSFINMLGSSYYLPFTKVNGIVAAVGRLIPEGSAVVFDTRDMVPYRTAESFLEKGGYRIAEHLSAAEIQRDFLEGYRITEPSLADITDLNFYLAVKKDLIAEEKK